MKLRSFLPPAAGAAAGLAVLHVFAPHYLLHQGFPLDDAWIHAVYARELARTGMLAYNTGVPATGETSPLWALVAAGIHMTFRATDTIVAGTKALGFALHLATVVALGFALAPAAVRNEWRAWLAAALVGLHPDLIAASVSGMEVPLATFICALALVAAVRARTGWLALLGALAFAARPETVLLVAAVTCLFWIRVDVKRALCLSGASVGGGLVTAAVCGVRNHLVSGRWLPATFYAKANTQSPLDPWLQIQGFRNVFGELSIVNHPSLLVVASLLAVFLLFASRRGLSRAAAALFIAGMLFCAVSFALVPPVDAHAFYHQRYILPALPFIVAALPLLVTAAMETLTVRGESIATGLVAAGCGVLMLAASPARARRLASYAHNIDDVQVAFGSALASAAPDDVVWVVDAGASRYFGRAFVVDMMGLNTPELLTPGAQAFLDRHPPRFLDLFPTWSTASTGAGALPVHVFESTTPYTVTSFPAMRMHGLAQCEPSGAAGRMTVRARTFVFHCG